MNFVVGTDNGSVALFNGAKLLKTKQLSGVSSMVGYYNGQIVAAVANGSLTVLNQDLGIIRKFHGIDGLDARSISGNDTYLALGDEEGLVRYYDRKGGAEPNVSLLLVL